MIRNLPCCLKTRLITNGNAIAAGRTAAWRARSAIVKGLGLILAVIVLIRPSAAQDPFAPLRTAIRDQAATEPFEPQDTRDEATEDQLEASARFTEGRLLFRREAFPEALQAYQRAYRYANGSSTILDEIVPLAFRLARFDEAARYASFAGPNSQIDPFVLRQLALYLTQRDDYQGALQLYQLVRDRTTEASDDEDRDAEAAASVITHFEIGRLLYLTEVYDEAAKEFKTVVSALNDPSPSPTDQVAIDAIKRESQVTLSLMAEAFMLAGQPDSAETLFQQAFASEQGSPLLAYQLARVALAKKSFDEALNHLNDYFAANESEAGTAPFELLRDIFTAQDQSDELIPRLEQLRTDRADDVFLTFFLAEQLLQAGKLDASLEAYQDLLEIRPLVDAYRGMAEVYRQRGDTAQLLGLLIETAAQLGGLEPLESVVEKITADDNFLDQLLAQGQQTFLSETSGASDQERQSAALAMAKLCVAAERNTKAQELYAIAAGEGKNANDSIWIEWGLHCLVNDQPAAAADVFRKLLDREIANEEVGAVEFYRAAALALDDQYDAAYAAATRAAEQLPDVATIQLRPAWVLFLSERWNDAYDAYTGFLLKFGNDFETSEVRTLVKEAKSTLSNVCTYLDRVDESAEWLEQVLDEFPQDIGAMNDLGYLWADRGIHLHRALRMTRTASQAEPENVAYLDSYGWSLYRLGRYDEAAEVLARAAAGPTPDGVILDHLGDAIRQTSGHDAAAQHWRKALDSLGDSDPERRLQIEAKLNQTAE